MREIKFRAWDKTDNEMVSVDLIVFNDKTTTDNAHILDERNDVHYLNEIVLMQSTGLKDNNGVEMYEGDIVCNERLKEAISWDKFYGWVVSGGEMLREVNFARIKVIGNIYENPELLERK